MMAQVGGAGLGMANTMEPGSLFVLGSIEKAKFRKQVRPLDTVKVEVENLRVSKFLIKQKGIAKVNGEVCAESTWLCVKAPKDAV